MWTVCSHVFTLSTVCLCRQSFLICSRSGPYTFQIGDTSTFPPYKTGGYVKQVKMPQTITFVSASLSAFDISEPKRTKELLAADPFSEAKAPQSEAPLMLFASTLPCESQAQRSCYRNTRCVA